MLQINCNVTKTVWKQIMHTLVHAGKIFLFIYFSERLLWDALLSVPESV